MDELRPDDCPACDSRAAPVELTGPDANVHCIQLDGREICIIGTAHVSRASADLVEQTIRARMPDVVCVELCRPRHDSLKSPERWRETDIFEVIRSGKTYVLLAQLILAGFQRRLAKKFGIEPGEEMRRALAVSAEVGAEIGVIDREIRTTLKRAWSRAGLFSMAKVIAALAGSVFSSEEISESEIEELKKGDALSALMAEFSDFLPGVKEVLIDERDLYMAAKIAETNGKSVVAVVGAGHVPGILRALGTEIDLEELEKLPPPSPWSRVFSWGIPLSILIAFVAGFALVDFETGYEMVSVWVLATGLLAALGTLFALAHPLTIATAFVAAPFTTLHPAVAAGWVCGLVEAIVRRPRVKDLETIADDISTISGFWSNRVSKILLVVILANLGGALGTVVGGYLVVSLLRGSP